MVFLQDFHYGVRVLCVDAFFPSSFSVSWPSIHSRVVGCILAPLAAVTFDHFLRLTLRGAWINR